MFSTESSELLWFIVGLILMLAELALPGFVIIFFGIGAWITALCVSLGIVDSFSGQLAVFLITSILTLILFRNKGRRYFKGRVAQVAGAEDALDSPRGQKAVAVTDIVPRTLGGKVEFNGTTWEAESEVRIPKGSTVEIVERRNLVLVVKPLE